MGDSTVSRFFEKLGENEELASEYELAVANAIRKGVWPVITEVGEKQGFAFSTEELESWLSAKQGELSDEALEGIAAGGAVSRFSFLRNPWFIGLTVTAAIAVPLEVNHDDDGA